ncbi:MAG: ABC transporter permease [Ferruginibacter sp.]
MLTNFFKTALRSLWKNKGYSFLNIAGLAIGIACAALIFLWVEDEKNYDSTQLKKDNLYLVKINSLVDAGVFTHSSTPTPMGPAIQTAIPGIENTCRFTEEGTKLLFGTGDKAVYATGSYAEPAVFDMFTLPFVQGNAKNAFEQVYSLVITEKTAKKFFGNDNNVIGKSIRVDNKQDYIVSGVIKDLPENSSLQFEWLAPFKIQQQLYPDEQEKWHNFNITTYVELKPGVAPESIDKKLYDLLLQKQGRNNFKYTSIFIWHERLAFV